MPPQTVEQSVWVRLPPLADLDPPDIITVGPDDPVTRALLCQGATSGHRCEQVVSSVGERALAALAVDEQVEVYHAHWGAGERRLVAVLAEPGDAVGALTGADWRYRGRYDRAVFPRTVDALGVDAVYHVSGDGVRVYLPVWPGFDTPTGRATGLFVRVETVGELRRLRRTVRFLKGLFHDAITLTWLDSVTARDLLVLALRRYCPPGRLSPPGPSDTR